MVMPAPGQSSYPLGVPPRRGHGCLWGCLGLVLLLLLPVILAGAYGSWFLHAGYRRDPVLRLTGELVRRDGIAHLVLGEDIRITGVEGDSFSWVMGMGRTTGYVVTLQGSRGSGSVAVTAHQDRGRTKLDSAVLTGPDGGHYDLLAHTGTPGRSLPGNTI